MGRDKFVGFGTIVPQNAEAMNNFTLEQTSFGSLSIQGNILKKEDVSAPTFNAMDDTANTFTFNPVSGFNNTSLYEYSMDGGNSWADVTTNPISVGNVVVASGSLQVRLKGTSNYDAGAILTNATAFTTSLEGSVAISGTATYGETLTATVTGQQAGAVLSYKWMAGTTELQSGTSNTLKIPGIAVGKAITVEVTATGYTGKLISSATASVGAKTVTAIVGTISKVYDGTNAVEAADRTLTIEKVNGTDDITVTAPNATYNDKTVGTGKAITFGDLTITGTAADWYIVTAPSATGTITAKPVTVTITANNKVYDSTNSATVTYTVVGKVGSDSMIHPGDVLKIPQ